MRAVESHSGNRGASGHEGVAQSGHPVARRGGQGGDGGMDIGEGEDPHHAIDGQPDRRKADPARGETLTVAETGGSEVDAGVGGQDPASSAGSAATAAIARSVDPIATATT